MSPRKEEPVTVHDPELRAAIRAEVRRQLAAVGRRYLPILVGVMTLVMLVVLVPDRTSPSSAPTGSATVDAGAQEGQAGLGTTPGEASASESAVGGSRTGSPAPGGTGSASAAGTAEPGSAAGTAEEAGGTAVSGVTCGPGVRQVTWSPYSPMCVPRWSGNNGGATAHGVTESAITLVLRRPSDWDALSGGTGLATFAELEHDTRVLVSFFNRQFELYGREVVVETFDGRGSFTNETGSQGQPAANADAQTAYDLGAFVDGFPFATGAYADAEAARQIVHFSPGNSLGSFRPNQPYRFGLPAGPVSETQGAGVAAVGCQRMANMNAAFAGDDAYHALNRRFAVLEPEQPSFAGGADVVVQQMQATCDVQVEKITYSADLATMPQQAIGIIARLKADDITTVFMLTDPLMSQFMTAAAGQQDYHPEWVFTVLPQALARQIDPFELAHSIVVSPWHATTEPPDGRLCSRIYQLADPGGAPQAGPDGLDLTCSLLLALYSGLQQAGPNLSAETFARGWFSLPDSDGTADFGRWSFAPDQFSPLASFSLLWWNASATSQYDGGTGQFEPCSGPVDFLYLNAQLGTGPLTCFGR